MTNCHRLIGGLVTSPPLAGEDQGPQAVLDKPTGEVFSALAGLASEQGDAQGFPNPFKVLWHGAREALRTASYYEMKNRGGVVGWWYPAASMLNNEDDQAASDLTYRWGGMGHDGFQQGGAEQFDLRPAGEPYPLRSGHFYRLRGDEVIKADQSPFAGAHSDIKHPEVVWAALAGATTGVDLAA
ncbi:hypothetical protein [Kitasatospora sp. NPDC051914]|uniref:hypothetical protein n=1 Tax=Kitasatospora sp. NPDC051914 TaxID=3154945 RepID=UPI003444C145